MKHKMDLCLKVIVLAQFLLLGQCAFGGQRRISVGSESPEFSAVDVAGKTFAYKHGGGKALMFVFLAMGQERSGRAVSALEGIVSRLSDYSDSFETVLVVTRPRSKKEADSTPGEVAFSEYGDKGMVVLGDEDYEVWGKFGVIVTPTVIISGKDDKVLWVEAGFGYAFAPVVEARLKQALGLATESESVGAGKVRTVNNSSSNARAQRHLRMAKLLRDKGREKSAIREVEKALAVDPNSVEVALELGEIYCKKGEGEKAVKAIGKVVGGNRIEKARVSLVFGWANRLAGKLDAAEEHLLEAVKQNPRMGRALFELGRVYQAKEEFEKSSDAYYRALKLVYSDK